MKKELIFYQNIYKMKSGAFFMYQGVHDSIESAKKMASVQRRNGDEYVGTVKLGDVINLLK